tara:strand:- start:21 stop:284 length:264 start_codon:yes stop_codon:yes gene_type:complete
MNEYLAISIGVVIGGVGAAIYLGREIKELKNIILDKRTVVRFLKEALAEVKPKRTYRKKYNSNGTNGRKKSTKGMKTVTRKKYEKAS